MGNDKNPRTFSDGELDRIRKHEQRKGDLEALYYVPAGLTFCILLWSDARLDLSAKLPIFTELFEMLGAYIIAFAIVLSYLILIAIFRWSFYKELGLYLKVLAAWVAWAWFFYAVWIVGSLKLAFVGLFVMSLLVARTVGWILFAYEKIREGMFVNNDNET